MAQTVIGIFNSANEAQSAVEELVSNGFDRSDVDISSGNSNYSESYTDTNSNANSGNESGISRFFKNLFGDDDDKETQRYTRAAERGTVVTVHAQSTEEAQRASALLDSYGAIDVDDDDYSTSGAGARTGYLDSDITSTGTESNYSGDINTYDDKNRTIPVIEENLQVGKREVETGGVRLRSRIIEKPVEESLRLREEHVRVERNTVDRPATEADFNNFNEGTVELTERAEVPVVSKEARVVEEVSLGKEVKQREETIRDTVRKTEVDIEEVESDKKSKRKK